MIEQPYLYGSTAVTSQLKDEPEVSEVIEKVRPFSMVPAESLLDLARQVSAILRFGIPGDFVECGVWNGGASFLMAEILRRNGAADRRVWLFDSFEGQPSAEAVDGSRAQAYKAKTSDAWYLDNCRASLEEVREMASTLGLRSLTEFVPGWFDKTLPEARKRIGPIALLRIDGGLYASDKCVLDMLYDQVVEGGLVTVNAYYTYEGSALALHEFLGDRRIGYSIEAVKGDATGPAYHLAAVLRKGLSSWDWFRKTYLVDEAIRRHNPPGQKFILIDDDKIGGPVGDPEGRIPFVERNGRYWGPPADDSTAIEELKRLRSQGARLLALCWPSFWWLEHYEDFADYLHSTSREVTRNEALRLFCLSDD